MSEANFSTTSVAVLNATNEELGSTQMDRAIALVLTGRADIVESDPTRTVRALDYDMPYPLVIRRREYVYVPFYIGEEFFSRTGVIKRDNSTCAYCGKTAGKGVKMTWDHIFPRSRGGDDSWMNAITACTRCNSKKANRTPEEADMPLMFQPSVPKKKYYNSGKKPGSKGGKKKNK